MENGESWLLILSVLIIDLPQYQQCQLPLCQSPNYPTKINSVNCFCIDHLYVNHQLLLHQMLICCPQGSTVNHLYVDHQLPLYWLSIDPTPTDKTTLGNEFNFQWIFVVLSQLEHVLSFQLLWIYIDNNTEITKTNDSRLSQKDKQYSYIWNFKIIVKRI